MSVFRGFWGVAVFAILALAASPCAQAAELTLFSNATDAAPLVATPVDTAHPLIVSVMNADANDAPAEYMTSWEVRLRVVPDAGTVGSLDFSVGAKPVDYVFAAIPQTLGLSSAMLPGDPTVITALDLTIPTDVGAEVPTAPGANLLAVLLAPSSDALGTFGIYTVDQLAFWTDASTGIARDFVNAPMGGGPVRIGTVLVTSVADYNRDGAVDAADYTVWRNSLGQTGTGLAADGDASGTVGPEDYGVWKMRFGEGSLIWAAAAVSSSSHVPEPESLATLLAGIVGQMMILSRRRDLALVLGV